MLRSNLGNRSRRSAYNIFPLHHSRSDHLIRKSTFSVVGRVLLNNWRPTQTHMEIELRKLPLYSPDMQWPNINCNSKTEWLHTVSTVPAAGYTTYVPFKLLATHCTYRSSCWLHTVHTVPAGYTMYVAFELLATHCTYRSNCWLPTVCTVPAKLICTQKTFMCFAYFSP